MGSGGGGGGPVQKMVDKFNPITAVQKDSGLAMFPDPTRVAFGGQLQKDIFGGGTTANTGPTPPTLSLEQSKSYYREKITADQSLDEGTRASLLADLGTSDDLGSLAQRYGKILDPESDEGKKRVNALERAKLAKDTPGLAAQTSFLAGGGSTSSGGYLGGR